MFRSRWTDAVLSSDLLTDEVKQTLVGMDSITGAKVIVQVAKVDPKYVRPALLVSLVVAMWTAKGLLGDWTAEAVSDLAGELVGTQITNSRVAGMLTSHVRGLS